MTSQPYGALRRSVAGLPPLKTGALAEALRSLGDQIIDDLEIAAGPDGLSAIDRERIYSTTYDELATLWEADIDTDDRASLIQHLRGWIRSRPVNNQEALSVGIAALDWETPTSAPAWSVCVVRGGVLSLWIPTFDTSKDLLKQVRQHAWQRAQSVNHDTRIYGGITVWSSRVHPALSTTLLASSQWVEALQASDLYVALAQSRAHGVLTCDHEGAERLKETSRNPLTVYHSSEIETFPWK